MKKGDIQYFLLIPFAFLLVNMITPAADTKAVVVSQHDQLMGYVRAGALDRHIAIADSLRLSGNCWLPELFEQAGEDTLWLALLDLHRALNMPIDTMPGYGSYTKPLEGTIDTIILHSTGNWRPGADALSHARIQQKPKWARKNPRSWNFTGDDKRVAMSYNPATTTCGHVREDASPGLNARSVALEVCQYKGMKKRPATDRAIALAIRLRFQFPNAGIGIHRDIDPRKGRHRGCPSLYPGKEADMFIERVERAVRLWKELRR